MQVRLSLTISGAVALGAYEGGALAALIHAIRPLLGGDDAPLRLDAVGGASAGSITGLLTARTVLEGLDPVQVMQTAWVEDDGIGTLLGHTDAAPLSIDELRQMATRVLQPAGSPTATNTQSSPVRMSFVLACLRGLDYTIPALRAVRPVTATSYIDFYDATLRQGEPLQEIVGPAGSSMLDAVLASSANAMGFPPYILDRAPIRKAYDFVTNFPASNELWYTDGGTLNNEPLGRTLDLTNTLDSTGDGFERLHVLIHPHPTGSPTDDAWADPARRPTWVETLQRASALQRTQSLFADLKQVEKTNSRIAWANDLVQSLSSTMAGLPAEGRQAIADTLRGVVAKQRGQREQLREGSTSAADAPAAEVDAAADLTALLTESICTVAGVAGRTMSAVEIISPLLIPPEPGQPPVPVEQLLSGEFLFHFGGFLDRKLRMADFDLGYLSTLAWLEQGGLGASGHLSEDLEATALHAAKAAYSPGDSYKDLGKTTLGGLSAMDKLQAVRLAAHLTHVIIAGLAAGRTQT